MKHRFANTFFENGVIPDIIQGFVYEQLSKVQTHNLHIDIIGTKGIVPVTCNLNKPVSVERMQKIDVTCYKVIQYIHN